MSNIKHIKYIGNEQTYDLEIEHPDHQYYLSNGMLTSNSHAVAYSMISYQTAYLKAHYPLEFLVANLSFESGSTSLDAEDNVLRAKNEIRKLGIRIVPPDINKSEATYTIVDNNTVMTGFDSLKYIGKDAIPEILAKRPFRNFEDFLSKVDGRKVKAPAVKALAASGCLDSFGMTRKQMFLYASDFKKKLQVWLKKNKDGGFNYPWPNEKDDWTTPQKYALERYYIGEGLSASYPKAYPGFFNSGAQRFKDFPEMFPNPEDTNEHFEIQPIQAVVMDFFEHKVKKADSKSFGQMMGRLKLEDQYGTAMNMTVFPKQWKDFKSRVKTLTAGKSELVPGLAIMASGVLQWYDGEISMIFDELLKCSPPPPVPTDLKDKKVSMRLGRGVSKKTEEIDREEILEQVEEEMIEDGTASYDSENEEDYIFDEELNFIDGFN